VQILHLAPVELPAPAVRRLASSPLIPQLAALDPHLHSCFAKEKTMLWTICIILLVLWALGMATSYTAGGLIHILLVIGLIVLVFRLIQGRRVLG